MDHKLELRGPPPRTASSSSPAQAKPSRRDSCVSDLDACEQQPRAIASASIATPVGTEAALDAPRKRKPKAKKTATQKAAARAKAEKAAAQIIGIERALLLTTFHTTVAPLQRAALVRDALTRCPDLCHDQKVIDLMTWCIDTPEDPTGCHNLPVLDAFFAAGMSLNSFCSYREQTPLYHAVARRKLVIVHKLLNTWKADPNVASKGDLACEPLYFVASEGWTDMVRALLDGGARVDLLRDDSYPVHQAIFCAAPDSAKLLFAGGKELLSRRNETPLQCAINMHREALAVHFISEGADLNCRLEGLNPLQQACEEGLLEVAKALVSAGININDAAPRTLPPLALAAAAGDANLCMWLIQQGVDRGPLEGRADRAIREAAKAGMGQTFALLCRAGQRIDALDAQGYTPLAHALERGHSALAQAIVKFTPKNSFAGSPGCNLLQLAILRGAHLVPLIAGTRPEMVPALLNARTSVGGCTVYHLAAIARSVYAFEALVRMDAQAAEHLELRDDAGMRPVDVALASGDVPITKALLAHSTPDYFADVIPQGMLLMCANGHTQALQALLESNDGQALACLRRNATKGLQVATACPDGRMLALVLEKLGGSIPTSWSNGADNFLHDLATHHAGNRWLVDVAIKALGKRCAEQLALQRNAAGQVPGHNLESSQRKRFTELTQRGLSRQDAARHAHQHAEAQAAAKRIEDLAERFFPKSEGAFEKSTAAHLEARVNTLLGAIDDLLAKHAQVTLETLNTVQSAANAAAWRAAWRIHHVAAENTLPVGMGQHWLRHAPGMTHAALLRRIENTDVSAASRFERGGMTALLRCRREIYRHSEALSSERPGRYVVYLRDADLQGRGYQRIVDSDTQEARAYAGSSYICAVLDKSFGRGPAKLLTMYPMEPSHVPNVPLNVSRYVTGSAAR